MRGLWNVSAAVCLTPKLASGSSYAHLEKFQGIVSEIAPEHRF